MHSLLVFVSGADAPVFGEIVFRGGADLQRVGRVVVRIDEKALAAVGSAGQARWIGMIVNSTRNNRLINSGEGVDPAVLRKVVVIEADASAEHSVLRRSGSVGKTEARSESFPVVMRNAVDQRNVERIES